MIHKNSFNRLFRISLALASIFTLSIAFCAFSASAYDTDNDAYAFYATYAQTDDDNNDADIIPAPETDGISSTSDSITVTFKESQADGFSLWVSDSADFSSDVTVQGEKTLSVSGLLSSTTYYLKAVAYKTIGENTYYSEPLFFTFNTKVIDSPTPDFGRSNSVANALRIEFNKVNGAEGYRMWIADNRDFKGEYMTQGGSSLRFDYLKADTTYYLKAYTYKRINGRTYFSEPTIFTYKTKIIDRPTPDFNRSNSVANALRIEFNKVNGAEGYRMWIADNKDFKGEYMTQGGSSLRFDYLKADTTYYLKAYTYKRINGRTYFSEPTIFTYKTKIIDRPTPDFNRSNSVTNALRIEFNKVNGAEGYRMWIADNKDFKGEYMTQGGSSLRFDYLKADTTYYLKAYTYKRINGRTYFSEPTIFTYKTKPSPFGTLFYIKTKSTIYDKSYRNIGSVEAGSFYSGYFSSKYPSYAILKFRYGEVLINQNSVSVQSGTKMLNTAAIGQFGDNIAGYSACGPAAVSILINSEKNESYNKDDLILFSEKNALNDQGSLRTGGGMTAPKLLELIKRYSNGKYSAKNIYGSDCSSILKKQIDGGHRAIVVVQYTSSIVTHYSSGTHYVVVCGYEYINGTLYFYYADPYYGNGGRSLLRVSASTLQTSMNMVIKEPKAIIVLN